MSEIIKILKVCDIELELKREIITNEANIDKFINGIKALKTRVFDFSTKQGIKEAKELKTEANKFVKELKEFCDPLEADGKKVAEARSKITTTLATGKEAVIDQILAPVLEREEKIKVIKSKLFVPSLDSNSNAAKLAEVEGLKDYKWLAFEEEALQLIEQHKQFLLNEKIKFDEQERLAKEAAEKARIEKEEAIRVEAEAKAKLAAQKEIDEANARAEKAKIDAEAKVEQIVSQYRPATISAPKPAQVDLTIERQKVVHNEILKDLADFGLNNEDFSKDLIKAIANGKIRNLKITY